MSLQRKLFDYYDHHVTDELWAQCDHEHHGPR